MSVRAGNRRAEFRINGSSDATWIDDVGAFAGDIGSRCHGHADGCVHERRRVVDAIADHRHPPSRVR
jgi:hypothetical protein